MSSNVPAHKQTDSTMKPGQVVFSPEPGPNTAINPLGFAIQPSEKTLDEYIRRKQRHEALDNVAAEKKLTFDQWLHHRFPAGVDGYAGMLNMGDLEQCWKAAQENK